MGNQASCWYVNGQGYDLKNTPSDVWDHCGVPNKDCTYGHNDDALWWALAFIRFYDYSRDTKYLEHAEKIFDEVSGYWGQAKNTTSGPQFCIGPDGSQGGIAWLETKNAVDDQQNNSITNELFLETAVRLHLRTCQTPDEPQCQLGFPHTLFANDNGRTYVQWANDELRWFEYFFLNPSNMTRDGLIQDQLTVTGSGTIAGQPVACTAFNGPWTYNNGVIFGGLTDMAEAEARWPGHTLHANDVNAYLAEAYGLADKITNGSTRLTDESTLLSPIVIEPLCTVSSGCDTGNEPFKGIFMRYLGRLNEWAYSTVGESNGPSYGSPYRYTTFITNNAASLFSADRRCASGLSLLGGNTNDLFGEDWRGTNDAPKTGDQSTQNSALDALVAAAPYSAPNVARTLGIAVGAM